MSETAPGPGMSLERRFGGTARLLLGFIVGALFALVPMYYFYMGREAGLRAASPPDQPLVSRPEAGHAPFEPAPARAGTKPFASRLTYELSRPPEERLAVAPPPPPPKAMPASVASVAAPPRVESPSSLPAASSVVAAPPPAERVANARPISVVPLDPRDRTLEIEREAQKPEYRETPRAPAVKTPSPEPKAAAPEAKALPPSKAAAQQSKAAASPKAVPEATKGATAPPSRVFEGKPVQLKPLAAEKAPETVSRPAPPNDAASARVEPETDRLAGVTPIKPVAKSPERTLVATAPATSAEARPEPPARTGSGGEVESKLEATRGWLAAAPATTHTIQLMGANSEEHLKAQLKSLSKVVEPGKLHIFRTKAQGKPSITVVYGEYADRQAALQALEKLPASITANKPVLRTVSGIKAEMKQNDTGG